MVIIILKIFLAMLSIAFGYISFFIVKEYKKFKESQQSEGASLIDRFMIGSLAFSSISLMIILSGFCILMICSSLSITLPF
jgi:hypothetical protein